MPTAQRQLRNYRWLLLGGGTAYLCWWVFVTVALPNAFNPFGSRIAVVASFFAAAAASYLSPAVVRHLDGVFTACTCLLTAHYFYLLDANRGDLNWVVGSYITVVGCCVILQTSRALLIYSGTVLAMSAVLIVRQPELSSVVFLPGLFTNLVLANVGFGARFRLLERLREAHALALRELTERRRAEIAMARANRGLESFSYSVAHDLRSPLRAVDGFSKLLLEEHAAQLDAEGKEFLGRIGKAAQTMGHLIDGLLELARIGRNELKREPVDLSSAAAAAVEQLRAAQPDRAVELVNPSGIVAEGDPRLLRTVLDNLLGNAWKFTSRQAAARVELGTTSRDGAVVYFVRDNGAGFDMAHAGRLFGPFHRLHDESEFPGTGIGLATVQRIIEAHGGSIWAEATVGQGATFFFTLETPPAPLARA